MTARPEDAGPGRSPAGLPRERGLAALASALFLLVPPLQSCAEEMRPVTGGLRVGVRGSSFRVPVLRNETPPFGYPRSAWERGVGGETRLRIHITEAGRVDSAYVLASSGHAALDSAALAGARELRYRPAMQDDEPVAIWAVLPVRYPMPERTERP